MSENTNIVKNWAVGMLRDVDSILGQLVGGKVTPGNIAAAIKYAGEIKGSCEAIITAMIGTEDHRCTTCKHFIQKSTDNPCNSCKFRTNYYNDNWYGG